LDMKDMLPNTAWECLFKELFKELCPQKLWKYDLLPFLITVKEAACRIRFRNRS